MRIAFLGAEGVPYPAAFAKHTEEFAQRLVKHGHEVVVYCRKRYVDSPTTYKGIQRIVLPSINTKHLDTISHTLLSVMDLLRHRVDVVSIHGIGPAICALIPRLAGMKVVVHFHTQDWQREKWGRFAKLYLRLGEYLTVYLPHATTAISRTIETYCWEKFDRKVVYLPSGINPPVFKEPREIDKLGLRKEEYILFLARLVPEKGCHYLIQAFEGVSTDKKLIIAGGADRTEGYVDRLRQTKDKRICFLGHVGGRLWEELLTNAYLYVLPSDVEGLPTSLLEAMSYGLYVLCSDIRENLEAMGSFGLAFKRGDSQDLREKLQYLVDHPEIVHEGSEEQMEYILSNYSWDDIADRLEALYLALSGYDSIGG